MASHQDNPPANRPHCGRTAAFLLGALCLASGCTPAPNDHEERIRKLESELGEVRSQLAAERTKVAAAPPAQAKPSQPVAKSTPDFVLPEKQLLDEIHGNQVLFNSKYMGKTLQVEGLYQVQPTGLTLNSTDAYTSGALYYTVRCNFSPTHLGPVANLPPTGRTKVIGLYLGTIYGKDVTLESCRLADVQGSNR